MNFIMIAMRQLFVYKAFSKIVIMMFLSVIAASQFPVARLLQAVMESVPANADIHFEINQNAVIDAQPG